MLEPKNAYTFDEVERLYWLQVKLQSWKGKGLWFVYPTFNFTLGLHAFQIVQENPQPLHRAACKCESLKWNECLYITGERVFEVFSVELVISSVIDKEIIANYQW